MKTLEIYRDAQRRFRWRVRARNGRIQATSRGYRRLNPCVDAACSVLRVEVADDKALAWGYSIHDKRGVGFHAVMKVKFEV